MAYAGQIIQNPVSGERIEFTRTATDTNGELLEFELTLTPDGRVPGAHVHPEQEEAFEVLEGTMKFRLGLRTIVAEAGETVVVPVGRRYNVQAPVFGLRFWIRPLSVSATQMVPSVATSIPLGVLKRPAALVPLPKLP